MKIERAISPNIKNRWFSGKVIVILGPRQVGKTTLAKNLLADEDVLHLNGDDPAVRRQLKDISMEALQLLIGDQPYIFIDEAQRIDGIGITLKMIVDNFEDRQVVVSGSSAFELNQKITESLTGRKWTFHLYPISWEEFMQHIGYLRATEQLHHRLRFGMYPDVINHPGDEEAILIELAESYLYRDVLSLTNIRRTDVLAKLVQALAYQMGQEVSYNELAQLVGADKNTVSDYITMLEQAFVVFRLTAYSRNLRNEIKKNQKIYFYDTGIRNAVIQDFRSIDHRMDVGMLWEQFLIVERMKVMRYQQRRVKHYFWRTRTQVEVDLVELGDGEIRGYEFKWNTRKKYRPPRAFIDAYDAEVTVIDSDNYLDFIMGRV